MERISAQYAWARVVYYKELWYKEYISWVKCGTETEFKMKISNNNVT